MNESAFRPPSSLGLARRFSALCDIDREWTAMEELPPVRSEDLLPVGYRLILETNVVRKFLAEKGILGKKAEQTAGFRRDFHNFALDGTEGYVLSLVAGALPIRKILLASTLGRFRTLFVLAMLRQKGVLLFVDRREDLDSTWGGRRPPGDLRR